MTEATDMLSLARLSCRPDEIDLDLTRTAVVVIDMENDFCAEGGSTDTAGYDISEVRGIIDPIAEVLTLARSAGIAVVYLQHAYAADLSDLGPAESRNAIAHLAAGVGRTFVAPDGSRGRIGIMDTWNTAIIDELAPRPGEVVVRKTRFSGFYETELDETLRAESIDTLLITGCTTSVCVDATIRDAMHRDYRAVLLEDCTAEPQGRANHDASVAIIESTLGWVSNSSLLRTALKVA